MNKFHGICSGLFGAAALVLMFSGSASASIVQAHTVNCGGFDSCNQSAYNLALGGTTTDEFLDFSLNSDNGSVSGDSFSSFVTFSTGISLDFGGADSPNVLFDEDDDGGGAEIGPVSSWSGIFNIDFASAVSAVGFGSVAFTSATSSIKLFDGDTLLLSIGAVSNNIFDFVGFVTNGGEKITRVQLEGDFFAIQNLSYSIADVSEVPVPAGLPLFGTGIALMGYLGWRRKRKAA